MNSLNFYKTSQKNVLIVDQFSDSKNSIKKALISIGFDSKKIFMVNNSNECINFLKNKEFDIIFCEYNLGKGKNGQQLLEYLNYNNLIKNNQNFIIITSECSEAIVLSTVDHEPDGYITKPFSLNCIKSKVKRILHENILENKINNYYIKNGLNKTLILCEKMIFEDQKYFTKILKIKSDLLFNNNRYEEAYLLYKTLIYSNPNNTQVKIQYANSLIKINKLDEAKCILDDILFFNKRIMIAYDLLEEIYILKKDIESRLNVLKTALDINPMSSKRQKKLFDVAVSINHFEYLSLSCNLILKYQENSIINDHNVKFNWIKLNINKAIEENNELNIEEFKSILFNFYSTNHFLISDSQKKECFLLNFNILIKQPINKKMKESFIELIDCFFDIINDNYKLQYHILYILRQYQLNSLCDYFIDIMNPKFLENKEVILLLYNYKRNAINTVK